MIVLDTNVVSDFFAPRPSRAVLGWLNAEAPERLFMTSIVLAELYFGAFLAVDTVRRQNLLARIGRVHQEFSGRVLSFSEGVAERYGMITARRRLAGRPIETKDAMIAAICLAYDATLATRNVRDFEGLDLKLVNPFEAAA
ncbi:type II toxin-antitoxin system VapC family toxin [Pseudaminobacter sp. 19-2017]|uniref:Ribonuclease VapC n=1 Tax=Pseudaminobacter soli (ex Zhang et al. 2022) TaxID=2831468 RepID=A0A942I1X1_9HYPH|nr:type II toxin-antitoxin system VapC family toxin [Pseudaminobacter soli]MBS3648677.1 type II toxin-antitoxin system VapC family toxin [Pseudaminobacter soli]